MTTINEPIDWLVARGRDPLEAVFIPAADDLYAAFPGQFVGRAEYEEDRLIRLDIEEKRLDRELKAYLARMPVELRTHLGKRIERKIESACDAALKAKGG